MPILAYPSPTVATKELPKHKQHTTAVILWGRFQPPHIGHLNNFKAAHTTFPNADIYIMPTGTCDSTPYRKDEILRIYNQLSKLIMTGSGPTKRKLSPTTQNEECQLDRYPLTLVDKIKLIHLLTPSDTILSMGTSQLNEVIAVLTDIGYKTIILYLGPDQLIAFQRFASDHVKIHTDIPDPTTVEVNGKQYDASATLLRNAVYFEQEDFIRALLGNPSDEVYTKVKLTLETALNAAFKSQATKLKTKNSVLPIIPTTSADRRQKFLEYSKAIEPRTLKVGGQSFFQTFLRTV